MPAAGEEKWRALAARKWAEIEEVEVEGRRLFFGSIRRRTKGGGVEELPVAIRPLRNDQKRKAFFAAVKWAQKEGLLPPDLAGMENIRAHAADPKLFEDLENISILALALREPKEPYDQFSTAERLEAEYDLRSLSELWGKYKTYEDLTDPSDAIQTDAEFWSVAAAIRSTGTILPLNECASPAQNAFILRTVDLSLSSPAFNSFCTQFASSMPAS